MNPKLRLSSSPHIHSGNSIPRSMYGVLIALIPAWAVSLYFFGVGALIVTAVSVTACICFEYLIQKYLLRVPVTTGDGSALLTGVLLAFNLPSNLPVWIILIGALVSIGVAKMSFGGLGNNIFNPALVGRVFLLISFPAQMTSWPLPGLSRTHYADAVTAPTPLSFMGNHTAHPVTLADMALGNIGGSLGEVCSIALLAGLLFLLWRKIITWHIPVSILATVALFSFAVGENPLIQLLTGGLLLGAIFMATDYVTSPMSGRGMLLYGVCIGLLTVIIRKWSSYPEGVSFAILIMNAFTPLINQYVRPARYGEEVYNG